jgi:hypothetical protein
VLRSSSECALQSQPLRLAQGTAAESAQKNRTTTNRQIAVETEVLVWDLIAEAPKPAADQTSFVEAFDGARRPEYERLMGDSVLGGALGSQLMLVLRDGQSPLEASHIGRALLWRCNAAQRIELARHAAGAWEAACARVG